MNWREKYKDKLVSPEEAISHIRSGDRIHSTLFNSIPYALLDELGNQASRLENVELWLGAASDQYIPLKRKCNDHIKITSAFHGPAERVYRDMFRSKIDLQVIQLSRICEDRLYYHPGDVIMMAAAPPDENGMVSFGLTPIDTVICKGARDLIVQFDENLPYVWTPESMVHMDDITCAIDCTWKITDIPKKPPTENQLKIAANIAERIPDGACIQFGIGGIGDAVGQFCMDKKHLGIHTELFTDSMIDLMECGAVDNSMKNIDKGISIFGISAGGTRMNKFMDHNPACQNRRFNYSNNPYVIAKNDNVYSINSGMQVDFSGQVASEGIGYKPFSGIGGQLDYVRGAQMSKGGHSFIAMESVYKNKLGMRKSRICLYHPKGTAITTPRSEVEFIVTEYGIANLKYESMATRAKRLIEIAHPDFRDKLTWQAKRAGFFI